VIPVWGLIALHQGINHTPQHQQAAVDAGGLTLLLTLSPRLGQALATCMNSRSGLWEATVPTQADEVVKKEAREDDCYGGAQSLLHVHELTDAECP